MPLHVTSLLCLLSEAHRGEGLGIPSPHLGCLWLRSSLMAVARLWLVFWFRAVFPLIVGRPELSGPDARHLGRYGPEGHLRAHRRPWQWHVQACFYWIRCILRYVPSDVARPKLLDTMAGMDQKDSSSCLYKAGIHRVNTPRAVFSSLVRMPMMLGIMARMDQKSFFLSSASLSCCIGRSPWSRLFSRPQRFRSCSTRLVLLVFYTSHAVFPVAVHRP